MSVSPHQLGSITYFVKGENPKLLLLTGMHGDESGVIDSVTSYVEQNAEKLPDFLYIPQVSPSAVAAKTRINSFNHDVNRQFFDDPKDPEVANTITIISPHHFNLCLNFHEDPDLTREFYLYDTHLMPAQELEEYKKYILNAGAILHTGIDDAFDENLKLQVNDGYVSTPQGFFPAAAGFAGVYLIDHSIVKRFINPEIPGKGDAALKNRLVASMFSLFLPQIS